jgi:hypothetical protein
MQELFPRRVAQLSRGNEQRSLTFAAIDPNNFASDEGLAKADFVGH